MFAASPEKVMRRVTESVGSEGGAVCQGVTKGCTSQRRPARRPCTLRLGVVGSTEQQDRRSHSGPLGHLCQPAGSRPAAVPASLAKPLARPHAPVLGGKRRNPLRRPVSPTVPAAPGPAPPPPVRFLDPGDHEAAFAASGFNIHTHQSMCIYLTGLAQTAGICQNETIILHFTAVTSSGHISRI